MLGKKSMSMQKFSQYTILYSANVSMAGCLVELRTPEILRYHWNVQVVSNVTVQVPFVYIAWFSRYMQLFLIHGFQKVLAPCFRELGSDIIIVGANLSEQCIGNLMSWHTSHG